MINFLVWLFPVLFLIDDILGFNGYQFTIAGRSIRIILFCISVAVLCCYCIYVLRQDRISVFSRKSEKRSLFSLFKPLDYLVLLFVIVNMLWATVVPLIVRGEMIYSLKDFSTVLVLVLYFPVSFLIRTGRLNLDVLKKLIYILTLVLAGWHVVMYLGEVASPGFYESYYDWIDVISFGTAVRTDVVYGFGIVRVIQVTSILLLLGIFQSIQYIVAGKKSHFFALFLFTFAICVTYTKSIWFGYLIGLVLYLVPSALLSKDRTKRKRCLSTLLAAIAMIVALDLTVFEGTIHQRAVSTVHTDESISEMEQELEDLWMELYLATEPVETQAPSEATEPVETQAPSEATEPVETQAPSEATEPAPTSGVDEEALKKEIEAKTNEVLNSKGTQVANAERNEQTAVLLSKWRESKWFGFGYGSYAEECIRNEQYPFMYESTLPALMMKLGIVGCLLWVIFIAGTTVISCKAFWKRERTDVFWWLGTAVSYAMAVQTNPFLFTFSGFSALLYLLVVMQKNV